MCWCKDICSLKGGKDHKIFCLLTNRKIFRGIKKNTIKNKAEILFPKRNQNFYLLPRKILQQKNESTFLARWTLTLDKTNSPLETHVV